MSISADKMSVYFKKEDSNVEEGSADVWQGLEVKIN